MLALEFVGLFFLIPTLVAFAGRRVPALPTLWVISAVCLCFLLRDPKFDQKQLWDSAALPPHLTSVLLLFGAFAALLIFSIWRWNPASLFELPRRNPLLWVLILFLYPVLSVYPQGIVFRAFLVQRYASLFGSTTLLIIASALAFGYMHIVFRNGWAVGLSFLGGLIFAARFVETRSLFLSSFEHALYGCALFTAGMGSFFYHGSTQKLKLFRQQTA